MQQKKKKKFWVYKINSLLNTIGCQTQSVDCFQMIINILAKWKVIFWWLSIIIDISNVISDLSAGSIAQYDGQWSF